MLLTNLYRIPQGDLIDLEIRNGYIHTIKSTGKDNSARAIPLEDAIVFPGLINSHDHLDFNLFPQLGNRKYKNYVEWGTDIHANNKETIEKVLKVPYDLRIQWGAYKNLLNGITTVVNHGPKLRTKNFPIEVLEECKVLHSVRLEKNWKLKLNLASGREPVVIHIGEGTDQGAHTEIDELLKWNLFEKKLIGIHAIAMNERQASKFHAVVWCPDSNYFLIGHTAAVETLARNTRIVFGTDSTVSARWSIWEHLRHAQREKKLSDLELFNSVTVNPAQVWKLKNQGQIAEKYTADFVVAKGKSTLPMEAFFSVTPEDILLVVHKGKVVLFDERLHGSFDESSLYQKIKYPSSVKFVKGKLGDLVKQIKSYYPGAGFPFAV